MRLAYLIPALLLFASTTFFGSSAEAALTPISAEQACNSAASIFAQSCLERIQPNAYYDGIAAAACAQLPSPNIPGCVGAIANKYFQPEAVEACSTTASVFTQSCLEAVANKVFSASTVSTCGSMASPNMGSCFQNAPHQVNTGGRPTPIDAIGVCSRLPNTHYDKCMETVSHAGGPSAFDNLAVGICNRILDANLVLQCLDEIAGLRFRESSLLQCAQQPGHDRVLSCLRASGQPAYHPPHGGRTCALEEEEITDMLFTLRQATNDLKRGQAKEAQRTLEALKQNLNRCRKGLPYELPRRRPHR